MTNKKPVKVRDLNMWKRVYELVAGICQMTKQVPEKEMFGLAPQIWRSGVSMMVSIAETFEQERVHDKLWFLSEAKKALSETRYYLVLAGGQDLRSAKELIFQAEKVSMLLELYVKTLKK